jgi:3-demethoxyubiquinol 3-hydroxylase
MNLLDHFISSADDALRALATSAHSARPNPARDTIKHDKALLTESERTLSQRLMRVNHTGEVCAQALYAGQLLFARTENTRAVLEHARREEIDHLAWCEERIDQLGGRQSALNPLFYVGSFALGATSAILGDETSLSFLAETESQVESHLTEHLLHLPESDSHSKALLEAMREDEIRHGQSGIDHGGKPLPPPIKLVMKAVSTVMTRTSYWV